jgi:hypothetical protein
MAEEIWRLGGNVLPRILIFRVLAPGLNLRIRCRTAQDVVDVGDRRKPQGVVVTDIQLKKVRLWDAIFA